MEVAVKWIYQEVKDKRGIPLEAGQKPALCFRGRKHMLCVAAGLPVRVLKRVVADFDKARVVMHKGREYTVAHAVHMLDSIATHNGITDGARKLLDQARAGLSNDVDEDQYQDEEGVTAMTEKPAEQATTTTADSPPATDTAPATATAANQETATVATTSKKKAKKAKATKTTKTKAAKGKPRVYKEPSADSKIGKAVAYMRAEVSKAGGQSKLERGFLKDLFARTHKKCGVALATASSCYSAFIRK